MHSKYMGSWIKGVRARLRTAIPQFPPHFTPATHSNREVTEDTQRKNLGQVVGGRALAL